MQFGYRYDTETGLYYLQSRYYNPEWGRFINADAVGGRVGSLLSHNVFIYCMNNPINMSDSEGTWPTWNDVKIWITRVFSTVAYLHPGAFVVQDSFPDPYNGDIQAYEADKRAIKESIMFGAKGVKVTSKTIWQNGKTERIDVENPSPGKRPGDIHYHESDNTKWRLDVESKEFINPKTFELAPSNIQKLLNKAEIKDAINKGLKLLGEAVKLF